MDEKVTKPTIETVLERMQGMEQSLNQKLDDRFDFVETRLDRIEALTSTFRAEVLNLRADFRELRHKVDSQTNPS